jgi:hypothetical protein
VVVCDGCGWGFGARKAARDAAMGFHDYLLRHHQEITDIHYASHLVARSVAMAQHALRIVPSLDCHASFVDVQWHLSTRGLFVVRVVVVLCCSCDTVLFRAIRTKWSREQQLCSEAYCFRCRQNPTKHSSGVLCSVVLVIAKHIYTLQQQMYSSMCVCHYRGQRANCFGATIG